MTLNELIVRLLLAQEARPRTVSLFTMSDKELRTEVSEAEALARRLLNALPSDGGAAA